VKQQNVIYILSAAIGAFFLFELFNNKKTGYNPAVTTYPKLQQQGFDWGAMLTSAAGAFATIWGATSNNSTYNSSEPGLSDQQIEYYFNG